MIGSVLVLCYVLGPPAIALAVCRACGRHRALLWLGGIIVVGVGTSLLLLNLYLRGDQSGESVFAWGMVLYGSLPFLAAGLILLIGGFVRWGQARG
jgi:hypothetical protein